MAIEFDLNDAMGRFVCRLTRAEADAMRADGRIAKVGRKSYRMICAPDPSMSGNSRAILTGGTCTKGDGGDLHKWAGRSFAGGRLKRKDYERILGHLLHHRLVVPVVQVSA